MTKFNEELIESLSMALGDEITEIIDRLTVAAVDLGMAEDDVLASVYVALNALTEGYNEQLDYNFIKEIRELTGADL